MEFFPTYPHTSNRLAMPVIEKAELCTLRSLMGYEPHCRRLKNKVNNFKVLPEYMHSNMQMCVASRKLRQIPCESFVISERSVRESK